MKILGKVNEWNVLRDQFTVGTPIGDIKIITGGCQTVVDMFVKAMKERKPIHIEVEE